MADRKLKPGTFECQLCGKLDKCAKKPDGVRYWDPPQCSHCGAEACDECLPGGRATECVNCEKGQ